MAKNKKWMWVATSNDGCYTDRSECFDTKEECYYNMRNAVLEKMKWNTEWRDFEGNGFGDNFEPLNEDGNYISYKVDFRPMEIIHESYSGVYTYKVIPYKAEQIIRLKTDIHFECENTDELKELEETYENYLNNCINEFRRLHPNNVKYTNVGCKEYIPLD